MKIGIYIPDVRPESGGSYTFLKSIVRGLNGVTGKHQFFLLTLGSDKGILNGSKLTIIPVSETLPQKVLKRFGKILGNLLFFVYGSFIFRQKTVLEKIIRDYGIDLVWFPTPIYEEVNVPFMITVWDMDHRLYPFFPEISEKSYWENTERFYRSVLPKASRIFVGTRTGKEEVVRFYNIDREKIKVIPLPAPVLDYREGQIKNVSGDLDLPENYLFYPAQFWAHKNHITLLLALKIIREKFKLDMKLILTGSDKGNLAYVKSKAKELDLLEHVKFLDFVNARQLAALYKNAVSLVFPSYFGPDNLPPLEAFWYKCPVIASDVPGVREQLGTAAVLVDPKKPLEFAEAVVKIVNNPESKKKMIKLGMGKIYKLSPENYVKSATEIFDEFELVRRCWK